MRFISLCLIVILLAGCAAPRQISFNSKPAGALVQLDGVTCITPCDLPTTNKEVQFAQVSLAGGEKRVVRIEGRSSVSAGVGYNFSSATATTLGYMSIPLLAVGTFGLILYSGNETDSFHNSNYEYDRDGFYITMGALVAGGILAWAANSMRDISSDLKQHEDVYVVFDVPEEKRGINNKSTLTLDEFTGNRAFPAPIRQSIKPPGH